jgi:hypothetical protein
VTVYRIEQSPVIWSIATLEARKHLARFPLYDPKVRDHGPLSRSATWAADEDPSEGSQSRMGQSIDDITDRLSLFRRIRGRA